MEASSRKLQHHFFLILFVGILILMFFILRPFLTPLVLALALAILFYPVYEWIRRTVIAQKSLAALLTVCLVIVIVLIPLIIIGGLLFNEIKNLYINLATNGAGIGIINSATNQLQNYLKTINPNIHIDVTSSIQYGLAWAVSHLDVFFSSFLHVFLAIIIMVIALFYLFRDGARLRDNYILLSPLSDSYDKGILEKVSAAVNSVIKGSLIIAVIQGVLGGIGVSLAGLPNPIIWGILTMFASLIPGIGTATVIGPAIIYLFLFGTLSHAITLLLWQLIVVALIDNFLSPHLIKRGGLKIHPLFILLSVLGGIVFFGPIGFILGPMVLALLFALLDIYPLIVGAKE